MFLDRLNFFRLGIFTEIHALAAEGGNPHAVLLLKPSVSLETK